MANGIKYQAHEILNKVLNSAETGIQVDIVAGAEYAEDSAHTSADTGNFILGVRNDTLAALGGADGDYVPFQMNASGALFVEVSSSSGDDSIYVDDADWSDGSSKHTLVGGLYQSSPQSITDGDTGPLQVNENGNLIVDLSATDNAVLDAMVVDLAAMEVDLAAIEVLLTAANVDHAANEALLTTIDADTGAIKTAVETIDNAISGTEMQVDVVASLPAGSAAIGKLAANSGVDIGDVDVTSIVPGTGATNLGKAEDAAHSSGDTGVMPLAVRNDAPAALGGSDGDYAPLQVNSAGSLYTKDETGEAGSILVTGTTAVTSAISGTAFIAIQFIEDSVFASGSGGLIAASEQLYPDDDGTGADIDANGGANTDSVTFPQGMTIFGRWTGFTLASGKVIGYLGYV